MKAKVKVIKNYIKSDENKKFLIHNIQYNTIQYNLFPANGSHTRWRYKKNTAIQTYNINKKKKKQIIKGSLQTQTVFKIQLLEHTNTYIHSYTYKHTHKYIRIYTQIYCLYM